MDLFLIVSYKRLKSIRCANVDPDLLRNIDNTTPFSFEMLYSLVSNSLLSNLHVSI